MHHEDKKSPKPRKSVRICELGSQEDGQGKLGKVWYLVEQVLRHRIPASEETSRSMQGKMVWELLHPHRTWLPPARNSSAEESEGPRPLLLFQI